MKNEVAVIEMPNATAPRNRKGSGRNSQSDRTNTGRLVATRYSCSIVTNDDVLVGAAKCHTDQLGLEAIAGRSNQEIICLLASWLQTSRCLNHNLAAFEDRELARLIIQLYILIPLLDGRVVALYIVLA